MYSIVQRVYPLTVDSLLSPETLSIALYLLMLYLLIISRLKFLTKPDIYKMNIKLRRFSFGYLVVLWLLP